MTAETGDPADSPAGCAALRAVFLSWFVDFHGFVSIVCALSVFRGYVALLVGCVYRIITAFRFDGTPAFYRVRPAVRVYWAVRTIAV